MSDDNSEERLIIDEDELLDRTTRSTDRIFNIEVPPANIINSENSTANANTVDFADFTDFILSPIDGNLSETIFSGYDEDDIESYNNDLEKYQRSLDRVNEYITGILAQQAHGAEMKAQAKQAADLAHVGESSAQRQAEQSTSQPPVEPSTSKSPAVSPTSQLPAVQSTSHAEVEQSSTRATDEQPELSRCEAALQQELQEPQDFLQTMLSSHIRVTFVLPDDTTITLYLLRTLDYDGIVRALECQLKSRYKSSRITFELRCISPPKNLGKMPKNWTLGALDVPAGIVIRVIIIQTDM